MRLRRREWVVVIAGLAWPSICIPLVIRCGLGVGLALAAATIVIFLAYVWSVLPMRITCIRQRGLSTYWAAECRNLPCRHPRAAGRLIDVLDEAINHTKGWHR